MNAKKEKGRRINPKPAGEDSKPGAPTDLRKALAATPKAQAQWRDITPIARRDFMSWIDSAKQVETRRRRIEKACSMLAAGKRRPCCYSIVSFRLYTALAATPKAKAQWRELTPIERRDFIGWMDSAKQPETQKRRIEQTCSMLAAGKRRPPKHGFRTRAHKTDEGPRTRRWNEPVARGWLTGSLRHNIG